MIKQAFIRIWIPVDSRASQTNDHSFHSIQMIDCMDSGDKGPRQVSATSMLIVRIHTKNWAGK